MSCWIGRLMRCAMKTSGASETSHAAPSSSEQREREAAPQIAALDRLRRAARVCRSSADSCSMRMPREIAADRPRRRAAPVRVAAPQVVHVIAAGSRQAEALGFAALPERATARASVAASGDGVRRRRDAAGQRVLLQRVALALIELPHGRFERARQPIEFAGRRVAEAAIEQRRRDPDRRGQRQRPWRRERRGSGECAVGSSRCDARQTTEPERPGLDRVRQSLGLAPRGSARRSAPAA